MKLEVPDKVAEMVQNTLKAPSNDPNEIVFNKDFYKAKKIV